MSFLFSQPAPGIVPIDSISFAELAKVDASSVLGNPSGSLADASSITFQDLTQNNLTLFSDTEQGLVPASGGGTSTFLRADGSWATAGISTVGALDQQVLAYDSGTGLTTWQYAGLGDGNLGTNNVVLGRSKPAGINSNSTVIGANAGGGTIVNSTIIGANAFSSGNAGESISIGSYGPAFCSDGIYIGNIKSGLLDTITYDQLVIGNNCTNLGDNAISIGNTSRVTHDYGIVLGVQARAENEKNIAIGAFSSSGSGLGSIVIGANSGRATLVGTNNTVLGNASFNSASLTTAANNTILGQGSATALTTGTSNVIIGKGTATLATTLGTAFSIGNVIIGNEAMTAATNPEGSVVIGFQAATSTVANWSTIIGSLAGSGSAFGDSAVAIGHRSLAGQNSTAIGTNASTGSNAGSVAIGHVATAGIQAIALGKSATAPDNTFAVGSNNAKINTVFFGRGGDDIGTGTGAHPVTISCSRVQSGWPNVSGVAGTLTLNGANSTGNQPGGDVIIKTAPAGTAGSTANAYVEVMRVTANGNVGIGTSTPGDKLTVEGTITYTDGSSDYKISPKHWDHGTHTGTITVNFSQSPVQTVTLNAAGPLTINLNNAIDGGAYALRIIQGATPGTLSWPANVKWPGGTPPTLSTTTGDIDIVNFLYIDDGGGTTTLYGTFALDFA